MNTLQFGVLSEWALIVQVTVYIDSMLNCHFGKSTSISARLRGIGSRARFPPSVNNAPSHLASNA
jgi:hypothetical protein